MSPLVSESVGGTRPGRTASPISTISVLIVDDDELVAEVLAACLDEPDIGVVGTVYNSDDALMAAQSVGPDVALLDRRLGATDGIDLARELLEVAPGLKIVIITADPSAEVESAALEAGCVACVGKTMNIGDVLPELVRRAHRVRRPGPATTPVPPHPRG